MPKVLIADDDRDLVDILRFVFQRDGFTVLTAWDGEEALRLAQSSAPDLVVLDQMMPKRSGMQVLQQVRRSINTPVIMLTALGDEDHVVEALAYGADDYVVKPFRPRELKARAQALLRRSRGQKDTQDKSLQPLVAGDIRLDPRAQQVTVRSNPVQLSPIEFGLLHYLMLNRGMVMRIPDIIANVWGYDAEDNDDVVKVAVSRLRRKIECDPSSPRYILNVPRVGYKFESPD